MTDVKIVDWDRLEAMRCEKCNEYLEYWEAVFDADNPSWYTNCCGKLYQAYPKTMEVYTSDE